jgi:thiol-disulfide isomerase/thioredoxin
MTEEQPGSPGDYPDVGKDTAWSYGYGVSGGQLPYGNPYGPPPYGAVQGGYYPPYQQPRRTNGLAIASFICSVGGIVLVIFWPIAAIVGIALGFAALSQIKKSGGALGGKGLALAGIIVGFAVVVLVMFAVAIPTFLGVSSQHVHTSTIPAQTSATNSTPSPSTLTSTGAQPAPASVVKDVTTIPLSEFNSVGIPSKSLASTISFSPPIKITKPQPPLVDNGKPEVFYFGAEYCPFCATERWPMVVALSRFGTFSHLRITTSSAFDVYPLTNTFSFYKSTFVSPYLSFVPVEYETDKPLASSGGYTTLMTPTKRESALVAKYDGPPYTGPQTSTASSGSIPFVDIGNKAIISGASYTPTLLSGLNWYQIAAQIKGGKTTLARAAIGAANYITGAICSITKDQPSSVCTSAPVKAAQSNLSLG